MQYPIVILLRIFLRLPLALLAAIFYGLSQLFENLADGCNRGVDMMKGITELPYIKHWNEQIAEMDDKQKKRVLKALKTRTDA